MKDLMRRGNTKPLGTASWYEFEKGARAAYQPGDLWLGRAEDGAAVGHHDDTHAFVTGGNRSGKGVGFIIPNLTLWQGSLFVNDPKGENAILTARRRAGGSAYAKGMGQKTGIWDPYNEVHTDRDDFADLKVRLNPMDVLGIDRAESVSAAALLAGALFEEETAGSDRFFEPSAKGMFRDVMLHVASAKHYAPSQRTLMTVRALLEAPRSFIHGRTNIEVIHHAAVRGHARRPRHQRGCGRNPVEPNAEHAEGLECAARYCSRHSRHRTRR
jgi:type IV secretory pathway TraG/TraD family ATPase VirD4